MQNGPFDAVAVTLQLFTLDSKRYVRDTPRRHHGIGLGHSLSLRFRLQRSINGSSVFSASTPQLCK